MFGKHFTQEVLSAKCELPTRASKNEGAKVKETTDLNLF